MNDADIQHHRAQQAALFNTDDHQAPQLRTMHTDPTPDVQIITADRNEVTGDQVYPVRITSHTMGVLMEALARVEDYEMRFRDA